jgi:hypothetical protein
VVEGTGLENRHTVTPYREFESLPVRFNYEITEEPKRLTRFGSTENADNGAQSNARREAQRHRDTEGLSELGLF